MGVFRLFHVLSMKAKPNHSWKKKKKISVLWPASIKKTD